MYQDAALANDLDDLDRMKSSAGQSLVLAQEVSERRDIAIAWFYAGFVLFRQIDYEHAISLMEQSLKEFQEIHDLYWESINYGWLGQLLFVCGRQSSEETVNRHLDLARRAGERDNLAAALLGRAWQLYSDNSVEQVEKYANEAKELLNQIGSDSSEVDRLFCMYGMAEREF